MNEHENNNKLGLRSEKNPNIFHFACVCVCECFRFDSDSECNTLRVYDVVSKLNVAQCHPLAFGRYSTMRVKRVPVC